MNMKTAPSASMTSVDGSHGAGLHTAGNSAERASERSRDVANQTFDQLANAVESARSSAVPAIERLTSGAESMAHRSIEVARAKSQQMREQANLATEKTVGYVRQEPVKSLLIAAAAGALLGLLFSSSKRDR